MDDLDIAVREGLPAELRYLAERFPRGEWNGHTNFNELTRFWLDRHLMFRELQSKLGDEAQQFLDGRLDAQTYGNRLYRYASMFINNLQGHHQIEDGHYFPMLVAREKGLQRGFEMLDADHHALHDLLGTLTADTNGVLTAIMENRAATDAAGVLEKTVARFGGFLDRHLADEEELVVPVILEHGIGEN
ncbi:MAG: hemerythrin domain-containing protein [Rhizobiaceae bacterium]